MNKLRKFGVLGSAGILLLAFGGVLIWKHIFPGSYYTTPIMWWGYILLLDSIIFVVKGESYIRNRTKEFLLLILPLSLGLWLFFENYNNTFNPTVPFGIHNWHYIGLPDNYWLRLVGYILSFTTIFPGMLETRELLRALHLFEEIKIRKVHITPDALNISFAFGAVCLIFPLLVPWPYTTLFAAPVWIGFIFLLDPLNYYLVASEKSHQQPNHLGSARQDALPVTGPSGKPGLTDKSEFLGVDSLFGDLEKGSLGNLSAWLVAGFICGFWWEFWNFWAHTKWIYTVPWTLANVRIFEMPILGFFGFPPFALEYFAAYNLCLYFWKKSHR